MITLTELLNTINKEAKDGLINVEDWRFPDVEHLISMGFNIDDDFHMTTKQSVDEKNSKLTIYKKKDLEGDNKGQEYFYVEEPNRKTKRFKIFNDVINYFDQYTQPEIDKNK